MTEIIKPETFESELAAKKKKEDHCRMVFYALIDCAMRHREGFWRLDVENVLNTPLPPDLTSTEAKKMKRLYEKNAKAMQVAHENFGLRVKKIIEGMLATIPPKAQDIFNKQVMIFAQALDELAGSPNQVELMKIMQMYSGGFFDEALKSLKEQDTNKKLIDKIG